MLGDANKCSTEAAVPPDALEGLGVYTSTTAATSISWLRFEATLLPLGYTRGLSRSPAISYSGLAD